MYMPHLLYPFICQWTQSIFIPLDIVNNAAVNVVWDLNNLFKIMISFPLHIYPDVRLLDHMIIP